MPAPSPRAERLPIVGFSPTMLPNAAGTRPEPAVSVPSANGTIPAATAQPEPEDEPPGTRAGSKTLRGTPYGLRTPTSPVANWSRLVLPTSTAPAVEQALHRRRGLRGDIAVGGTGRRGRQSGHVDVVLHRERHAPQARRPRRPSASSARAAARTAASGSRVIQIAGSACARSAAMARSASSVGGSLAAEKLTRSARPAPPHPAARGRSPAPPGCCGRRSGRSPPAAGSRRRRRTSCRSRAPCR